MLVRSDLARKDVAKGGKSVMKGLQNAYTKLFSTFTKIPKKK